VGCWCIPRVDELMGLFVRPGVAEDTVTFIGTRFVPQKTSVTRGVCWHFVKPLARALRGVSAVAAKRFYRKTQPKSTLRSPQ
jgi:hypothetical protein